MLRKKRSPNNPKLTLTKNLTAHFGYQRIVGLDEVGRGALAGPIVVAAVQLDVILPNICDSKSLKRSIREELTRQIIDQAAQISLGIASNTEIDELGIQKAQELAYQRALKSIEADLYLTDFIKLPIRSAQLRAPKGESLFYPVAAASIVAKTYRDQLMQSYHHFFPNYAWENNVGYGTSVHKRSLELFGASVLHRKSFLNWLNK